MAELTGVAVAELSLVEKAALLSGRDVWQTRAIPRRGIRSIWMSDGPLGVRKQPGDADHLGLGESEPAVCFPAEATIANSWDEDLAEEIGAALGREAAARDVDVLLGPGLNLKRSPLGGRNFEYLSEDPELSGRLAAAYVRGIQSTGVAATPKHFAVNSQEHDRMVSDSVVDERTLRELYLTAFEIVVREARPWALMSSYNLVNGTYAHENRALLIDVLRRSWGFDGAVVSDWGGGNDPVAAVAAGGTIEMPSPGFDSARAIAQAVTDGRLSEDDVDARVDELVRLVERVSSRPAGIVADEAAHHALARRAAAAGAVLLRNQGGLLPLASGTRVALVGAFADSPRYQGAGSSLINPTRLTTLRGALAASGLDVVGYRAGYGVDGERIESDLRDLPDLVRGADVAVVALAVPAADETEGRDRPGLALPAAQVEALRAVAATGTPVIAVVAGGGPVEVPWLDDTTALLHAYLGGQAGAEAVADVLTGVAEPGGRLAETMPAALADDATARRFPAAGHTAQYREGMLVRYRYHATAGVAPAFPFGFGLGYTSFGYADLGVTETGASFTVTNTGERAGSDVAQLYVRRVSPSGVPRPAIELKGFAKVRLSPGQGTRVTIAFGERTFRHWDVGSSAWQVESGRVEILVGRSSEEIVLAAAFDVAGTMPAGTPDPAVERYRVGDVRDVPDAAFAAVLGRPVPARDQGPPPFDENSPVYSLAFSPSRLVRLLARLVESRRRAADEKLHPDLDVLFIASAPLRALHKMTAGTFTRRSTAAVVRIANGEVLRGLSGLLATWPRERVRERRAARAFERAAAGEPLPRRRSGGAR